MIPKVKIDQFADCLVNPEDLLDLAIEWIQDNLNPENVFTKDQLDIWAVENDYELQV